MTLEIKKREGESLNTLLYRFNKRIQQSGLLREVKKRQFHRRVINRRKKRLAAVYRVRKREELARLRKYGYS